MQKNILRWIPQKSPKDKFEDWIREQEKQGWLIELHSTLAIEPTAVDIDLFTGPFIGNQHLRGKLLRNITQFREARESEGLKVAEVETKEKANFYFMSKAESPEDAWGNQVIMGDTLVLKDGCKYIGFAQVNRKNDYVRFAANKSFWSQGRLSKLNRDSISEFIAWIDEYQADPRIDPLVSSIRDRNVWIQTELMFSCFYMTTNKPLKVWEKVLDMWLQTTGA